MALVPLALAFSVLAPTSSGHALQKDIKPEPPELVARIKASEDAARAGEEHRRHGRLEEAIASYRKAIEIEKGVPGFSSSNEYRLAKVLVAAKRPEEALAEYRRAHYWDPKTRDLRSNGPPVSDIANDYAILLAQLGKHEEAKAVYYSALRQFNPHAAGTFEPYPFLVVFDPDPTMTVWDYSPERLIAAARMNQFAMKGGGSKEEVTEVLDAVQAVAPEWVFPAVYRFFQSSNDDRPAVLDFAESLCATDEELNWVRPYRPLLEIEWTERLNRYRVMRAEVAQVGLERRKNSAVLQKAQDDLERLWPRIAVTFDKEDG